VCFVCVYLVFSLFLNGFIYFFSRVKKAFVSMIFSKDFDLIIWENADYSPIDLRGFVSLSNVVLLTRSGHYG